MRHPWPRLTSLILVCAVALPVLAEDVDTTTDPLPSGAVLRLGTARMLHQTWPTCVRFAPGDQYFASADYHGVIRFWDVATGKQLGNSPRRTGQQFAFSPDGNMMAIGHSYNDSIVLWDLQKHDEIRELRQNARALAFSSDGKLLAAAGKDKIVRLWNTETGLLIHEMKGHQSELYAVAFSPDDRTLASGGGAHSGKSNNEIRLWYVPTGAQYATLVDDNERLKSLPDSVYSLAFSRDGKTLGSCGPYVTRLWDVEQEKVVHRLEDCSYDVAFSPTEDRLVTCKNFGIYDTQSAQQKIKLDGKVDVYGSLAYSHDGKRIVSGNQEGFVQLWDAQTGKQLERRFGHQHGVRAAVFSPDGTLIASISRQDNSIRLWGTASGKELRQLPITYRGPDVWWNEEGSDIWFAPYGREVVTWTSDLQARYWRIGNQSKHSQRLSLEDDSQFNYDEAVTAAYSPNGQQMAMVVGSNSPRTRVYVFNLDGGQQVAMLDPFNGQRSSDCWISSLAFSPDGNQLAVGALHGTLRNTPRLSVQLWNIQKQDIVRRFRPGIAPPGKLCFSPDGKLLASSSTAKAPLQVWRVSDGQEVFQHKVEIDAHGRDPAPLAFSPDSKLLAAANKDGEIFVWELATQKKTHTFEGHLKAITSLSFSPDGKTLLSSSEDTTLLLWNIRDADQAYADKPLTDDQLAGYWKALADRDSDVAVQAAQVLTSRPDETIAWFTKHLTAGPVLDEKEIGPLVQKLESDDPQVHLKAAVQLQRYGDAASSALFAALADTDERAFRQRIESLLSRSGKYPIPPEELQRARAISVLEKIATPAAAALLKTIAKHDPPTAASAEAQAALDRMKAYQHAPAAGRP